MTPTNGSPGEGPLYTVTGASGFLGSHIVDALLTAGCRVRATVRAGSDRRWLEGKALDVVVADLLDVNDCRRLLRDARGVVHCAGLVSGGEEADFQRTNVQTTATLLEAARHELQAEGVFLLVSSLAAHGPAGPAAPAREDDPCRPITAYGRSKLAAEKLLTAAGAQFRTVILRPPALYGPRERGFLPLVRAALRGWTAWFGTLQAISLVDGRDAAAAAVALLRTPEAAGVFFVDDGRRGYDRMALSSALGQMAGRRVRAVTITPGLLKIAARLTGGWRAGRSSVFSADRIRDLETPGWVCDGRRLEEVTGWRAARRAGQGLGETLSFYRKHGWL